MPKLELVADDLPKAAEEHVVHNDAIQDPEESLLQRWLALAEAVLRNREAQNERTSQQDEEK